MKLKNVIAVSGHPNLMMMVSSRNNGLILKDPVSGKTNFFAVRTHQFTPLETVGIYTNMDTIDLKIVFQRMKEQKETNPPIPHKSTNLELIQYFGSIVPDFDRDRVYPGDIKKVLKWFNALDALGFIDQEEAE